VTITSGQTQPRKRITVAGVDRATAIKRLGI